MVIINESIISGNKQGIAHCAEIQQSIICSCSGHNTIMYAVAWTFFLLIEACFLTNHGSTKIHPKRCRLTLEGSCMMSLGLLQTHALIRVAGGPASSYHLPHAFAADSSCHQWARAIWSWRRQLGVHSFNSSCHQWAITICLDGERWEIIPSTQYLLPLPC